MYVFYFGNNDFHRLSFAGCILEGGIPFFDRNSLNFSSLQLYSIQSVTINIIISNNK